MKLLHIGRSQDNDVVLNDQTVSQRHAQLIVGEKNSATIIDLESTNGTFVNGVKIIGQRLLQMHDVVKLGSSFFKWQTYLEAEPSVQAPIAPLPIPNPPPASPAPHVQVQTQPIYILPKQSWSLLRLLGGLFILILVVLGVGFVVLKSTGRHVDSVLSLPETYDLAVECGEVQNVLIASEVGLVVGNTGNRTHDNVKVRVTGYDKTGAEIVSKIVAFDWALEPHATLPKVVGLPAKVRTCTCEIVGSNPR